MLHLDRNSRDNITARPLKLDGPPSSQKTVGSQSLDNPAANRSLDQEPTTSERILRTPTAFEQATDGDQFRQDKSNDNRQHDFTAGKRLYLNSVEPQTQGEFFALRNAKRPMLLPKEQSSDADQSPKKRSGYEHNIVDYKENGSVITGTVETVINPERDAVHSNLETALIPKQLKLPFIALDKLFGGREPFDPNPIEPDTWKLQRPPIEGTDGTGQNQYINTKTGESNTVEIFGKGTDYETRVTTYSKPDTNGKGNKPFTNVTRVINRDGVIAEETTVTTPTGLTLGTAGNNHVQKTNGNGGSGSTTTTGADGSTTTTTRTADTGSTNAPVTTTTTTVDTTGKVTDTKTTVTTPTGMTIEAKPEPKPEPKPAVKPDKPTSGADEKQDEPKEDSRPSGPGGNGGV